MIKLLDITGRSVSNIKSGEELNEIDVSTFPKGIYLIAAQNEFHYEVKKYNSVKSILKKATTKNSDFTFFINKK